MTPYIHKIYPLGLEVKPMIGESLFFNHIFAKMHIPLIDSLRFDILEKYKTSSYEIKRYWEL